MRPGARRVECSEPAPPTFSTDVAPMVQSGIAPVFLDVDQTTYQIDVSGIEAMIGPQTRAILVPNLCGNVAVGSVRRMATLVSFHAHPDDESIAAGGTLARAADAGHRTVLVFGTRGELGEPVPGVLEDGEQLALRRTAECYESAKVLGVDRVEFLGYTDSGMIGLPTNDVPWCFWQADVEHAARRLAAILDEEGPDVLTVYDDNGGYGHPDHIQVHRVGMRAAEMVPVAAVVQGTINRDTVIEAMSRAAELGVEVPEGSPGGEDGPPPDFGKPEAELTHFVDVTGVLDRKRGSMRAHASQIAADHFMASMPDDAFAFTFGTEWFIVAEPPAPGDSALFDDLFRPKSERVRPAR